VASVRLLEVRNTYKWGGGPDKTILLSAEQHDKLRVDVVVAYIRDVRDREFQISQKARAKGLTFYEIEERGKFDPRVLFRLREIIRKHDINLVHSHDYKSDLFAYLVVRWMLPKSVRLISTAHAWVLLGLKGELYRRIDLAVMRYFDHLLAVSKATKAEMVQGGVPADRITVLHNAIDIDEWSPARGDSSFRDELRLNGAFPVIGYVGRITPEKDLVTWLRAAAAVARRFPQARFVLVGDGKGGETQAQLELLASDLGLREQVIFPGYRSKLQPVYGAFDIFMLASRREGLPNCILEAMAMGAPIVTTDVAGAKELVEDQATGFVLPQGDVEGLSQSLLRLVEDTALRKTMGQAARRRIEERFSFRRRLSAIEDIYERLVQGGRISAERTPMNQT
jgi:glycosyltransferase involved in cell wall biosynthesis